MQASTSTDIDHVIQFLYINKDFFAAPFNDGPAFQQWAKKNEKSVLPLSIDMKYFFGINAWSRARNKVALRKMRLLLKFADIIAGNLQSPIKPLVTYEEFNRQLTPLLKKHADLMELFSRHMDNKAIDLWYQEAAAPEQKKAYQMNRQNYSLHFFHLTPSHPTTALQETTECASLIINENIGI